MALRGQRFTLDPDADNFTFNLHEHEHEHDDDKEIESGRDVADFVKEIKERETQGIPPPPKPKKTPTGFPQHRLRHGAFSSTRTQQQKTPTDSNTHLREAVNRGPSDRAIVNQIGRKYGFDPESNQKADISEENKRRIAQMSPEDIEDARSEIMSSFSPALLERLFKRANIEEDQKDQSWDDVEQQDTTSHFDGASKEIGTKKVSFSPLPSDQDGEVYDAPLPPVSAPTANSSGPESYVIEPQFQEVPTTLHFPTPPRNPEGYVPLDPDAPNFLSELKKHYFPDLPADPSTLAWLKDPTEEEINSSPYAPTQTRYAPSDIRFDFAGRLVAPSDSREIPISQGLHHHGDAPESAGYTIPELAILTRSALPNQRCIAYQVLGRILYRIGRGHFGPRGSELEEALWACVEKERPVEVMMSEANRTGGHVSAKAYAIEALWLWRKGGGGDRGVLKPGAKIAK